MARGHDIDYNFKLVLLGHSEAGKVSVVKTFIRLNSINFPVEDRITIAAAFLTETVEVDGKKIRLELWDTAGQERYHSLAPLYYRGAKGAVIVYDITHKETFETTARWIKEIQRGAPLCKLMLVGNKCHMEDRRVVSKERGAQLAREHGIKFLEVSVEENINVKEVFFTLARDIKLQMEAKLEQLRLEAASSKWRVVRPKQSKGFFSFARNFVRSLGGKNLMPPGKLKESGMKVKDLPDEVIYKLADYLNRPSENNWKQLTRLLEFSSGFIQFLESFPGEATERLLIQWAENDPYATAFELYNMLIQLEREDAAKVLLSLPANRIPPEILARGHLAVEAYSNALREGNTCIKRVPVMLIGQERSGKTSLKKSLRGQLFNPHEESTVGIERDPSHFKVTTEIWKTGEKDEATNSDAAISYEHHAAQLIVRSLTEKQKQGKKHALVSESTALSTTNASAQNCRNDSNKIQNLEEGILKNRQSKDLRIANAVSASSLEVPTSSSNVNNAPRDDVSSQSNETNVPDEIAALVEKLLLEVNQVEEDIYSVLWDFGGQSVYYVTHPLFLTARAMYLLVYDLSRDPHERAKPVVKQGMYGEFEDTFGTGTNLDNLDFWMTSLASLANQDGDHQVNADHKSEVLPEKLPPVFLVCTHADDSFDGADPCALARKVFGYLQTKPYKTQLYKDVFVVDNTKSGLESECSEVTRLRENILAAAKELPQMKEVIPVKWLKCEKALQVTAEKGQKWITLESAKQIASEACKIDSHQEFLTLLNFLHDQRILIHFDDTPVLNNLVVLDPQWLIDVFKKVITVKPYDHEETEYQEVWSKLETTGILEQTLLDHVWGPLIDKKETFNGLLAIMEKFSLLCPWPSSDASCDNQYLVPSMLMSHPPQDVINLVTSARIPSLFIKFESGKVPPGFFPRLILQFFQWGKDTFWSQVNPHFYYNFARFYTSGDDDCSVILLCHSSSVEVVVHRGNLSPEMAEGLQSKLNISADARHGAFEVACARAVQRQLGLMLESMRKEFCWLKNMTYEMSVICPVCCQGGVVKYCRTHHKQGCKREECLHFWSESELRSAKQFIICTRSATALSNKVEVKQFEPWFAAPDEQIAVEEGHVALMPFDEGNEDKSLALPGKVVESLLSQTSNSNEVVLQLKQSLHLDQSSLEQPDPGTKKLIRCLATRAKQSNRLDVVKHLREITPAGTTGEVVITGPLLPDHLDIRNIPVRQMRELTIDLSSGNEWMEVAEKLGLTPKEIRYLDKRTLNPCEAVLAFIAQRCHISVGDLYDVLNECGLPVIADFL